MTADAVPVTGPAEDAAVGIPVEYGHIDPELVEMLLALPPNPFGVNGFGVADVRAMNEQMPQPDLPVQPDIGYRDIGLEPGGSGPALRIIAPAVHRPGRPCIFWIHGGGFVVGSPFEADARLFRWAAEHDCVVVAVRYGLAPEHPFPQGLEDCYAGLLWAAGHADELGIDVDRIALVGESAGGGLAAALAILARDRAEVRPCFQLLIYPMLDDLTVLATGRADAPVWTKAANAAGWSAYLRPIAPGSAGLPVTAAPGRATAEQLRGLPPCFISVGSVDLFRAEDMHYAGLLQDAGVPTELHVYAGSFHGSDHLVPAAAISRRFERDLDVALGRVFAR